MVSAVPGQPVTGDSGLVARRPAEPTQLPPRFRLIRDDLEVNHFPETRPREFNRNISLVLRLVARRLPVLL